MPYAIRLPNGTLIQNIPDEVTPEQAKQKIISAGLFTAPAPEPAFTPPPPPPPEGGFFPSVKRGFLQLGMLGGDVLPAMVGKAVGAEEYAKKQWEEAAETQRRIEKEVPAAVPSYKDISGFGDAWVYAKEAVGETIASIIPSILTGGVVGVLARPAVAAANTAAREAAEKTLMSAAMKMGPPTEVALESAKKAAVQAGIDAAKRTAFRYEVAGGLAGSALQNIPEVYQNIKEETGKEDIPAALIAGGFNAALDTILPAQVLKKIRGQGLSETEVMAAWYKRGAKGLGKGLLIEGATEAAQEASSILAENFVAENSDVFNGKNLERVINAGIKGGLGGGVITAATDIATGKAPPKEQTDRQQIEQLQREITGDIETARAEQALEEAENAKKAAEQAEEARKEAERAPTVPEIFAIARGENGYGALEAEKQRLLELKEKTTDVKKAIEIIKETQDRLVIESQERKTPPVPAVMDDQTIRSLGFVKSDKETSVYKQLLGKSTADPDVTAFLQNYAETKAKPQTKERINTFLGRIERAQIPLTAEEVARGEERAGEVVTEPSGAGAPVVGEPGAGAPAAGVGITQPSGVVPSVAPVGEPPAGEGVQPAPVAAPSAPPVEPPAAEPLVSLPPRLQNITPAERNLYNFNQSLAEAQLPITGFDFERISDAPSPDGRGMTPERLVLSLEGALSAVKDLDGKLRSKNRTGATVSQLIDQWKTASQIQARINQSKQDTPELWNNYAARQKELGGLKVGDRIQIETGEIGRLDAKFPKNWRIVFDEPQPGILAGTKVLRPKEALRSAAAPAPAPKPTAALAAAPTAPTIITAEQLINLGVKKTQPMIRRIAGKNMDAPADRALVLAELNKYINDKKNPVETRNNLSLFRDQFEEVGREVTVAPTKKRKAQQVVMESALLGRINLVGGLDISLLSEFSEKKEIGVLGKNGRPLVRWINPLTDKGTLFRSGGLQDYVEIARVLEEAGYLEPGAVESDYKEAGERAKNMILAALKKQDAGKTLGEIEEAERKQKEEFERLDQEAIDAELQAEIDAERQAIMEEANLTPSDLDVLDANIPFFSEAPEKTPERLADDMRAMGFTEQEIEDAVAEFSRKAVAAPAPEARAEEAAQTSAAPEAAEELELEAPTAEELAAREKREADAREAEREEQKRLERKQKADAERGEFVLTGSDRPADVAEAAGQMSIFGKPSLPEAAPPKPIKLSKETQAKIEKLGGLLEKMLGKMGLKNVAVNLVQDLERNGEYANRLIKLALDSERPVRDLRHESLHAMKELGFFSDAQWATLTKMARDKWIDKYLKSRQSVYNGQTMSRYDAYMRLYNGNEDLIIEEAIADAFGDFDATKPPPGLMQAILFRMRKFFRNIKEAMGMANLDSAEDIFRRVEKGELKETAPAVEAPARASLKDAAKVDLDRSLNNKRVSPRLPTAVKATEDPMGKVRLQPDLSTFKRDPVAFRQNIGLMSQYPNFSKMKGNADQRAEQMIEHMKDNLLWLFNNWDDKLRDRSKLWYVGGNRIAHRWADKYGIPAEQAATVIAALSPQKDWFQNVSLAERTLDALVFNADTAWTPEMTRVFRERAWAKKFPLGKYEGKTLKEMYSPGDAKSLVDMAVWIRAWDEANNPQTARVFTPEGTFTNEVASGKPDKSGERKPIAMRAQSFAAMVKTLQMLQQTDLRVISDLIGKNHKVRSFYNNIIAPYAGDDVTIDTHAVAAALMRPLGSSDLEVYHNFGSAKPAKKDKEGNILVPASAGTKNSTITGLYGTYAMYAEAYRRAAREAGVLPREMQSITWEAIRGLFRPEQKQAALKQRTNVIWNRVSRGELSGQDARAQISELVSGIEDPAWVRSPVGANESPTDSSYATELPRTGVPGGRPAEPAGRVGERVAGAIPKASLRDAIGLYSELENKIAQGPNAAPAPQWKAYIKGLVQKGVKPEEIEWSGVNDWLDLQTGRVSKEALNNYLKQGGVRVEETQLGGPLPELVGRQRLAFEYHQAIDRAMAADVAINPTYIANLPPERRAPEEQALLDAWNRVNQNPEEDSFYERRGETKYGKYTLPGGENYREVLLKLPLTASNAAGMAEAARLTEKANELDKQAMAAWERSADPNEFKRLDAQARELRRQAAAAEKAGGTESYKYQSKHWDQPNVLAHIRVNDRTDADGNKVLFVEEIQSDWGQEGKKKGFVSGDWEAPYREWERGLRERAKTFYFDPTDTAEEQATALRMGEKLASREDLGSIATVMGERQQMSEAWNKSVALRGRVPSAPFVTKTEGWLNLALKRIMVMAAEGGYDKVAFVNGQQSADRYDLSKQIEDISYRKNSDGTYVLTATDKSGRVAMNKKSVNEAGIEDIVGKEIAQKIVAGEGKPYPKGSVSEGMTELSGLDLKVGGEGMKAFYDTIVPTAVKKLLPKVGGGQMGSVSLPVPSGRLADANESLGVVDNGDGTFAVINEESGEYEGQDLSREEVEALFSQSSVKLQQPGFDVTPDMKQKVQTTGLPRFSLREVPRANLRDQVDIKILQRVDQTTVPREEKSFAKRINEAIAPKNFSRFRQLALNRYEGLSRIDRMKIEQMGGVDLLADASAESAALMSDMGAGITASALGVHDRKGGAPVYKRYFVVEVNGRTLSKKYQDKATAEAAANSVNGVVRERGFTTVSNFNDSIKGPVAIFAPLMAKYKDPEIFRMFQLYSGIKRGARFMYTLDANGNAIEKLFTQDDLTNVFPRLEAQFPEFKEVHADWIKYNDKLVDFMRDTGIISAQNAQTFKMHGDYFPFYRQLEMDEDAVGPKIFQSIAAVKAPKKLKGSEIALGDFLENIVRNTQSAVQAGIKNVASRRAAQMGIDVGVVQELPIGVTPDPVNSFYVLENGLKKFYETGDHLFIESIKSLNLPDMPFIGMLAGPANLLRNLVTKDPGFILANLMRDSMSAWTTSGVKMTPLVDTARNFAKALASGSPEYEALLNAGVIGGYEFSQNVQTSAKEFGASIRKAAGVPTVTEQIAKPVTSLWQALEKATTASDAATRMEIYKKTLAETGNEAEALYRSLEVMNFNRKGSSAIVRILTAAVPFLNARMQGLDILYRAAIAPSVRGAASERERQIQKTFFVRGSMIMALSAMYWLLTHDDEEYKKQEQETRDNYWLLPSLGIKIPIPFEVGVLFKVIPERILAYTMGSDTGKDFLDSMKRQLLNTLAFNPIPQTFIPIVETVTNFSFFTWRPIIPQGMENIAPEYQVGPGTSKLAEGIGKTLNLSPMKIDQLINGYTGTMGMYAVDLMDSIYNTMADSPKPSKRFEQMPVIKRFAIDPEARGTVTAYYDLKNAVDQVVRTENLLERTMDYENWGPYVQENMRLLAAKDYVNDMEKTLKELREMKIMIRSSNIIADQKRDSLKQVGQMENALTSNIQELKKAYR